MRHLITILSLTGLAALGATTPGQAKTYHFSYSGIVTEADVFTSTPSEFAYSTSPGEMFTGRFALDTDNIVTDPIDLEGAAARVNLDPIDFSLPEEGFKEAFGDVRGELIYELSTGQTTVLGGHNSTRELTFNLALDPAGSFNPNQLFGESGSFVYDDFSPNGVHIAGVATIAAAVPEAGTWMMMILGFGAIGGMMRRAHRKSKEKFTRKVRSMATA